MILLAVDTSGPVAGVAVVQDGLVRYEAMVRNKLTHSENMMPMVEEALNRCGLSAEQLDLLGVTVGPGSFTGVGWGSLPQAAIASSIMAASSSATSFFISFSSNLVLILSTRGQPYKTGQCSLRRRSRSSAVTTAQSRMAPVINC